MVEKEKCVLCGRETRVSKFMPIEFRSAYVEGVGQLCPRCFQDTFPDEKDQSAAEWKEIRDKHKKG